MKFPFNKIFSSNERKNPQGVIIALFLLVIVAICAKNPSAFSVDTLTQNQVVEGRVVKVVDGDTIDVLDSTKTKHRIRFYGIDAPESKQAYGQKAKEFLASMIAGEAVKVVVKDKDHYGRSIGKVLLGNTDINKEMVANGYAWAYTEYSKDYITDEANARAFKLGLWQEKHPIKPSDFRRSKK